MGLPYIIAAVHLQRSHSQVLEGQVPVFIFPRNRVDQLYPQALCYVGGIRPCLHTGILILAARDPRYIASGRTHRKRRLQHLFYSCVTSPRTCLLSLPIATAVRVTYRTVKTHLLLETCLLRRCIETGVIWLLLAYSLPRECVYGAFA
jgi:hypothetical protein